MGNIRNVRGIKRMVSTGGILVFEVVGGIGRPGHVEEASHDLGSTNGVTSTGDDVGYGCYWWRGRKW